MNRANLHTRARDGRRVAVWRDALAARPTRAVLLCPGFARRMSELAFPVAYALNNGAAVYRYDCLDHVGLSDGTIRDFSLSSMRDSMEAAGALAQKTDRDLPVSVVAISLSALPALRVAAEHGAIAALACLVGVVDARRTLARVFGGIDYFDWAYEELPPTVLVEGHEIDPRRLWLDHARARWVDVAETERTLSALSAPLLNLVATEDEWVTLDEVKAAFAAPGGGQRELVELPFGGHELSKNPVALKLVMGRIMAHVLGADAEQLVAPGFEEIADLRVADRARAQEHRAALEAPALSAAAPVALVKP